MRALNVRISATAGLLAVLFLSLAVLADTEGRFQLAQILGKEICPPEHTCVHFLDVGQGDATFIESPTGVQVLIDGGPGSGVLRALGARMPFFDRTLDVVIATHSDGDHIGGLIDVFDRYRVHATVLTENTNDTSVSRLFQEAVAKEQTRRTHARSGSRIAIGGGAELHILFPDRNAADFESNAASIVVRLVHGETAFLFTGDAPRSVETYLVSRYGNELASEVLKVGHHGSKTSTADTFVSNVDPEHAVISAGADNRYGHPHEAVLQTLRAHDAAVYTTGESGTVTFMTDGEDLTVR